MKEVFLVNSYSCRETVESIDSLQLHQMLERKNEGLPLLIDVRQAEEYEAGHIPGALLVPLGQLEFGHSSFRKEKKMIVYCRSGKRSMTAALILCRMGFTQVMSLEGGILNWPYEQVTGPPRRTLEEKEVGTVRELFQFALFKEIETYLFYQESQLRLKKPELMKFIHLLVDIEKEHMEAMYSRYSELSLVAGEDIPSLEVMQKEFKEASTPSIEYWNELDGETALLESAVIREYQKYDFYKLSAENMKEESLRVLLYEMALEERAHASMLLKTMGQVKEGDEDVT